MVSHIHDSELDLDPRVRALLHAAAAPTEPGPLPGEVEAVAAFRATRPRPRRKFMPSSLPSVRAVVAAGLGTGVIVASGVGAAAAGALPGAAQDTARSWLSTVGVDVPGANERAAGHADTRGGSAEHATTPEKPTKATTDTTDVGEATATDTDTEATERDLPEASEHGQTVSELARNTEAEGADKGALVAGTASEGRSRAGEDGAGADNRTQPHPPSAADNATQPDTAAAAPGAAGRATADEASQGRRDTDGDRRP